ncbi:hypothetical protein N7457_006201 [Penicillium paradoxum]|uniref:uncharacterized protein n=1 Tax=Penicillium paradoxum TaxID=176176 RepID=UPI002546FEDA|nr:uncharacterized protein N7457_006201 [Penicillium paradoxum]KAJ5781041.1 hypothetical protein N7457_006201 [Penicillium paradoxum]
MGGLVIKKAYVLAKQDPFYKELAERVASLYFLATPHRGSDSAKMLKNLLKVAYDRAYINDLEPNSATVQVINDEFRHHSANIELWSFYETQNMKLFSSLIVDPESAVLGYPGEKQTPMTADHRSICKFDTPEDPNYALLRNALASTVSKLVTEVPESKLEGRRERIKNLKKYLDVYDILDDDLANVRESRMDGSCRWISTKASYVTWRDGERDSDRVLLIKGKPATGKSVLAGYVIDQLNEAGRACSSFFFKHGDKSKSTLSRCLRSLALQMATSSDEAGNVILRMQADAVRLDHIDERTLWRTLFLSGIFQTRVTQHYWIIDGLDECSNSQAFFHVILSNLSEVMPLRILMTSRDTLDLEKGFSATPSNQIRSFPISTKDTGPDIRLLVERRTQALGVVGPDDRDILVERILDKSNGSFLWTTLVLEELSCCHSGNEIQQALEDMPRGMESLYRRTLDYMSQATRGKELAKAILMWTACAVRPMTISELGGALMLEIHDSFPRLEESIAALCGQLVVVDKYERVRMVHETAREFLIAQGQVSEFSVDVTLAHTRMAKVCLDYLTGEEMKPPRNIRHRSLVNLPAKRLDFAAYACTSFSYHLSRANPLARETLQLIIQFLRLNVLTWIETIARSKNLSHLIHASKHLKVYLNACAVERSPLDPRIGALRQWSMDLARIPAMFASVLMVSPSAIYSVIPPFCPTDSRVHNTGSPSLRLAVLGAHSNQWDDRMVCIDFPQGQPRAVRYGDQFLAVGLSSGTVVLYHHTSHQEYKLLAHGEAVSLLAFSTKTTFLATCGMKMTKVWDTQSGLLVHSLTSPPHPLGMEFDGDKLLIASRKNYVVTWDLDHGSRLESVRKHWSDHDTPESDRTPPRGTPCALALSISHGMLAVAYSGQPITLWDMKENAYAGSCGKKLSTGETSTHVVIALTFNPNPDISLLAVSYLDGDLALLDPLSGQQLECFRANCQTLAASPNGRLLAAGGANGIIHIYEFDTLKSLYQVKSSNSFIKQLAFDKDSMRLADVQGAQCTVWEPEALLRESLEDDSSGTTLTTVVEQLSEKPKARITAMVAHHTLEVIFCGKDDGSVVIYEQGTAMSLETLYTHKSSVRVLTWIEATNSLLSIDASNTIFLHKVQQSVNKGWHADLTVLFKTRLDSEQAITDVLVGDPAAKLLLSTRESDYMFNLGSGNCEGERTYSQMRGSRKWLPHPNSSQHLICVDNFKVCIYRWNDWCEVSCIGYPLDNDMVEIKDAVVYSLGQRQRILLDLLHPNSSVNIKRIAIIDLDRLATGNSERSLFRETPDHALGGLDQLASDGDAKKIGTKSIASSPPLSQMMNFDLDIAHVIGIYESRRLIFLNRSFWVCSVDIGENGLGTARPRESSSIEIFEHFFIPYDWFAGRRDIVCALARKDIILTRGGELAVVRGGLDHVERSCVQEKSWGPDGMKSPTSK